MEENETEKGAEEVTMAEAEDAAPAKQPEAEEDRKTKTLRMRRAEAQGGEQGGGEEGGAGEGQDVVGDDGAGAVGRGGAGHEPGHLGRAYDLPLGEGFYDKHDWGTLTESQREAAAVLGITAHDFESESEEEEETTVVPTVVASGGQPGSG